MNTYDPGNEIEIFGTFQDVSTGNMVDPSTVACEVRDPDGNVTSPPVNRTAVGEYNSSVLTDNDSPHGIWTYRFYGLVPSRGAQEGAFYLRQSSV